LVLAAIYSYSIESQSCASRQLQGSDGSENHLRIQIRHW